MDQTILIVDAEAATREELTTLLTKAGYRVVAQSSVPSALQVLNESPPDLLITEIRLDAYNGLHLIAMTPTPIPAIVLTGFADSSIEHDARRLGAEYLVKPVAPAALCDLVARMLTGRGSQSVFVGTRQGTRRRLAAPVSIRVGQQLGQIIEVSENGARLEIHDTSRAELPEMLTLHIVSCGLTVASRLKWKRPHANSTWVCGVAFVDEDQPRWRAVLDRLQST